MQEDGREDCLRAVGRVRRPGTMREKPAVEWLEGGDDGESCVKMKKAPAPQLGTGSRQHCGRNKKLTKGCTHISLIDECIKNSGRVPSDRNPTKIATRYIALALRCYISNTLPVINRVETFFGGLKKFRLYTRS